MPRVSGRSRSAVAGFDSAFQALSAIYNIDIIGYDSSAGQTGFDWCPPDEAGGTVRCNARAASSTVKVGARPRAFLAGAVLFGGASAAGGRELYAGGWRK